MLWRLLIFGLMTACSNAWGQTPGESAAVVARTCVTCHHPDNRAIPLLPGAMNRDEFIARLDELRMPAGSTVMHRLLGALDDDMLEAVARLLMEPR